MLCSLTHFLKVYLELDDLKAFKKSLLNTLVILANDIYIYIYMQKCDIFPYLYIWKSIHKISPFIYDIFWFSMQINYTLIWEMVIL